MPAFSEFSHIGDFSTFPVAILDERAHAAYLNASFEEMTGYDRGEMIGRNPWVFLRGENTSKTTLEFMKAKMEKLLPFETSIVQYGKNTQPFWAGIYVVPFHDDAAKENYYAVVERELKRVGEPVMSNLGFSGQVGDMLSLAGKNGN